MSKLIEEAPPRVPAVFWEWPPLKAALIARHIGAVSRAYRRHPAHGVVISQELLARWLGRTQGAVSRIERAANPPHDLRLLVRYAQVLRIPSELLWFRPPERTLPLPQPEGSRTVEHRVPAPTNATANLHSSTAESLATHLLDTAALGEIEFIRRRITDTLGSGTTTEASLDDWELSVLSYGEATRWADGRALLSNLMADFADLERQLSSRQPTRAQRRLCRLAAQLAGLTSLVLTKMGAHGPARNWARTARLAATEAGDTATRSWVEAQEAYALFYGGGSPDAAAKAARFAQEVSAMPSVGGALAAALEARAHGLLGRVGEAQLALERANDVLARLSSQDRVSSAFGYNEAQLRFHEGNALTHLGKIELAWQAQKRALALYPVDDSDRLLVHLDRAFGLAHDGDADSAVQHALEALADTPPDQRVGIAAIRTRQLVIELQRRGATSPLRGELDHLLELTNGTAGERRL